MGPEANGIIGRKRGNEDTSNIKSPSKHAKSTKLSPRESTEEEDEITATVDDSLSLSDADSNPVESPRPENEGLDLPLPIPNRLPDADGHTCRSLIYEKCPSCKDFKFKEGEGKIKWNRNKKYSEKFNLEISTSMFNILYYHEEAEMVLFPIEPDCRSFQLNTKSVKMKDILQKEKRSKGSEKKTLIPIEFSYDKE